MGLPEEVLNTFPEDIRGEPSLQNVNDIPTLAKNYVNTIKMRGNAIPLPPEGAKPEDVEAWRNEHLPKLGARGIIDLPPSRIEDYELPKIEGFNPDPHMAESFIKDVAFATKMTPKQVEAVLQFEHRRSADFLKSMVSPEQAEADFKAAMGNDFASVNESIQSAITGLNEDVPGWNAGTEKAMVVVMGPDGKSVEKIYPFNSFPTTKGLLEIIGNMGKEDHVGGGPMGGGGSAPRTENQIREELKMYQSRDGIHHKEYIKNDPVARARVQELFGELAKLKPEVRDGEQSQ